MNSDTTHNSGLQDKVSIAVTALFEQYHGAIFAYLLRLLNDPAWAEDLTQDVFLQLFRHQHKLAEVRNERAWIYRIATNLALTALKRQRRFAWLPWRQGDSVHWQQVGPEENLGEETAVAQALRQIPATYRAPLLLYSRYDFNVREIALVLGISQGAVKNRLWRAREMFREVYERDE